MKSLLLFLPALFFTLLFTGCYTQFVMVDKTPPQPAETVEWVVDSATGDTVKVVKQVDTIQVKDQQTCVWERDLMGYPQLRCYDSFYPRDWFWYNNSPWWYRNDPYWYDYDRCPRFYYYDPSCGCCRYTGSSYYDRGGHHDNPYSGSKETGRTSSGGSTIYPRVRGVPDANATRTSNNHSSVAPSGNSTSASTRSSGSVIIPSGDANKARVTHERARGVPDASATPVAPSNSTEAQPQGTTANVNQQPAASTPAAQPAPATSAPAGKSTVRQSQQQQNDDSNNTRRRNTRGW
jgi:hypothetical protein